MEPRKPNDLQGALRLMAAATILLFVLAVGIGAAAFIANRARINDIQQSRIRSCELTYQAFEQVFHPFFRPAKVRTPEENRNFAKFNRTVARLQRGCVRQTN